jgi:hypothetical protein
VSVRGNAFPGWSWGLLCWWPTLCSTYQPSPETLWQNSQRWAEEWILHLTFKHKQIISIHQRLIGRNVSQDIFIFFNL